MKAKITSIYSACIKAMMSLLGFPYQDDMGNGYFIPVTKYTLRDKAVGESEQPISDNNSIGFVADERAGFPVELGYPSMVYSDMEFNFYSDIFPGEDFISKMKKIEQDHKHMFGNK